MQVWLCLLFVLHVAEGCTLEDHQQRKGIAAYTGESVLLPCYCADLQSRHRTFRWKKYSTNTQRWEEISSESGQYRNRVQLGNDSSPGNLSLLISHLTEEDGGAYRCTVDGSGFTDISLTVEGCSLTDRGQTRYVTAHRGGSVLLPCSCTELRTKPETFTWNRYNHNRKDFERILIESDQYRNRVQLVNDHSPGNLSLLISHLTEEDGGDYMCDGVKSGYTDIRLTVEGGPTTHPSSVTNSSVTVKQSSTSKATSTVTLTKSATMSSPPGSPSLPPSQSELFIYAAVGGLLLLMVLTGIICWRYRARRQRPVESCESKSEGRRDQETQDDSHLLYDTVNEDTCKKPQEVDDVTYSTVVHSNRSKPAKKSRPANKLIDTEETTEYASIRLN